jgi:Cytochrome c3
MITVRSFAVQCALLVLLGLLLVAAGPARSASPAAAPAMGVNETCLMCHADKDAKNPAGKSIAVDADRFKGSVHGGLSLKCTDCHSDVSAQKLPHADKLKPVDCAACHDKAVAAYAGTVHGLALKGGNNVAAKCTDCHGTHDIKRSKDADSRTNHANIEVTCSKCHGSDAIVAQGNLPGGNIGTKFHDSIHGKALKGAAQGSAPTCNNCHGSHDIRAKGEAASHTSRANIPATCGTCHKPESAAFLAGQHGKLRQDGNMAAPGCTDCHSAHGIQQHESAKFQVDVIKECGTCHSDYLKTYRDTFHGQVTALGYARMATCASCHGAHEVLPASNPASKVSKENRLKTCQQCHAGASANFASFDPHANRHDKARNPLYYYAALFMELLLFGVFAFFGIHTLFWFYREVREKFGGRGRPSVGGNDEGKH